MVRDCVRSALLSGPALSRFPRKLYYTIAICSPRSLYGRVSYSRKFALTIPDINRYRCRAEIHAPLYMYIYIKKYAKCFLPQNITYVKSLYSYQRHISSRRGKSPSTHKSIFSNHQATLYMNERSCTIYIYKSLTRACLQTEPRARARFRRSDCRRTTESLSAKCNVRYTV